MLGDCYAQSIIGATEKRRESGAVCKDIGGSGSERRKVAVYQGCVGGVGIGMPFRCGVNQQAEYLFDRYLDLR